MESKFNNDLVNIHFGVHKTATTYIQQNLEKICDPTFPIANWPISGNSEEKRLSWLPKYIRL